MKKKIIKITEDIKIGEDFIIIAGPCAVESYEQMYKTAIEVKKSGAHILRAGAFKPRTSPYDFQGLKEEGIKILSKVGKELNIPTISEIPSEKYIKLFEDNIDIIQVGARNMDNYYLLEQLGKIKKPIFLKRGNSATIDEFLLAAEYIRKGGNENIILCERGIRSFDNKTRNLLDITSTLVLDKLTTFPVIIDPSHATGRSYMIEKTSICALAVGANGIMVEVHYKKEEALSDGMQSLRVKEFDEMVKKINYLKPHFGKIYENRN